MEHYEKLNRQGESGSECSCVLTFRPSCGCPYLTAAACDVHSPFFPQDLSKIAMPVNFNEPISFTQRLSEDLEYTDLLGSSRRSPSFLCFLAYLTVGAWHPFRQ
jgi:hypothetical protein